MKQIFIKYNRVRESVTGMQRSCIKLLCILMVMISAHTAVAQSNISYAEYYLDQDPGLNNGTPITLTPGVDLQNLSVTLNMTTIRSGAHFFGTRARTATGVWSMNHYWIFFKPYDVVLSPAPLTNITKVEYYVDTDPGIGNATSVAVTPGTNLADITFSINPTTLAPGMHMIGSRTMTSNGLWSFTNFWMFYKPFTNLTPGAISNVNYVEYFVDNDPGLGNATSIAVAPALSLDDVNFSVNIANSKNGTHIIGARAKDAGGKWSFTNYWLFVKPYTKIDSNAVSNVTALEYFLDYDPGPGKGTPVAITPGSNIADQTFNVDLTNIVGGTHFVSVRAKDANGRWSFVNSFEFTKPGTPPTITTLVSGTTFCAGSTINVGYQLSAVVPFSSDNKYVVQLSDISGNFAYPTEIGSLNSTNDAGTINCTIPADAVQSGSYKIRVITTHQTIIGANNGTALTIYALPNVPNITRPSLDSTVCQGNTLTLNSNASGYSAQWLLNGTPISGATSYTYTVASAQPANQGTYSLRLTNSTSCSVQSAGRVISINTNVPATPTLSPSGNIGLCLGDSKILTSSAATNNQWFKNGVAIAGATGATYPVTSGGTYTVSASNGTCAISSSNNAVVVVGVPPTKPTLTTNGPTAFCENGSVTFTSSSFTGNQWYRNGVAISGSTAQNYNASTSGFYKTSVVNGSCEVFSDSIQVVVTPNVQAGVSMTISGNNVPEGTSITFTATPVNGGSAPQYTWRVNSVIVQTGPSNTFTSSTLANNSSVYVAITGNAPCSPGNTANSNTINVVYSNPITITGRISHPTGLNIPTPMVRVSGGAVDSTVANDAGNYTLTLLQQRNYVLAPAKNNDDVKAKGVNVLDVLQIQNHILNKTLLGSPYKIIAADANSDNSVNIFDVLAVKRLILGMDETFAGNKLWSFVDSTYSFPNPLNPFPYASTKSYSNVTTSFTKQSFFGVKLGDVNFDWTPTAGQNRIFNTTPVQLYYDTVFAENGDLVRLKIRVKNFSELMGIQFTLGFDQRSFDFAGIENKSLSVQHNEGFASKGAITFIWNEPSNAFITLPDGSAMFDLVLRKKRSISKEDIVIDPGYTPAMAYGRGFVGYNVVKGEGKILEKATPAPAITFDALDVSPNPSEGLMTVIISAKEAKKVVLVVTDVAGRTILEKQVSLVAGKNQMQLDIRKGTGILSGTYYLKAKGLDDVAPKQLMIGR